jgi:drug/metabolite transporter (DMT)-like permease
MLSVALALAAATSWGVSDFLGGITSRRLPLLWVLLLTQLVGLLIVVPFALTRGAPPFDSGAVAAAMLGSLAGLIGIAGLYRAIALGVASIAAPISATGAVLPVAFGLVRGEPIAPLQALGLACALLGVIAASRTSQAQAHLGRDAEIGIAFAFIAALGFGGFFILLHEASTRDVWWAVSLQRATGSVVVGAILLARRERWTLNRRDTLPLVSVGVLDQTANVLYALASTVGLVSLAAVVASLYPVVTIVLARLILNERISGVQKSGVALALTGVALIAGR